MNPRIVSLAAVILAVLHLGAAHTHAALITGVSASTNDPSSVGNPNYVANGAGLPGNVPALAGTHTYMAASNVWVSAYGTGHITFNLGGSYFVSGMSFWPLNGNNTVCIKDVQVLSSTDGSNFTPVPGAPSVLPQGPWVAPVGPTSFSFTGAPEATHIRFNLISNYGYRSGLNYPEAGLAEVQFDGTPVPEPGPLGLLALIGLSRIRRRR